MGLSQPPSEASYQLALPSRASDQEGRTQAVHGMEFPIFVATIYLFT